MLSPWLETKTSPEGRELEVPQFTNIKSRAKAQNAVRVAGNFFSIPFLKFLHGESNVRAGALPGRDG